MERRPLRPLLGCGPYGVLLAALLLLPFGLAVAAPRRPQVVVVLGSAKDGRRLEAAAQGARLAAAHAEKAGPLEDGVRIEMLDDHGTEAGLHKAVQALKAVDPIGVVAMPTGGLEARYLKAADQVGVPWVQLCGLAPDALSNPGNVLFLGPTPVAAGLAGADAMRAPLTVRRVGVVHESSAWGRETAAAFVRNLSPRVSLAAVLEWSEAGGAQGVGALKAMEAEMLFAAVGGAAAQSFAAALQEAGYAPRLLFADGTRDESLLALAPQGLEQAVFLDGPDVELTGRLGERLVLTLQEAQLPQDTATIRAYEGVRRVLDAVLRADSLKARKVQEALDPQTLARGVLGPLAFEPHGAVGGFAFTFWRVRSQRFDLWETGRLPTEGCGPPIHFGRPPLAERTGKGKVGVLSYGEGAKRTIEAELEQLGLSTAGAVPELDAQVREEILARAMRIAHRLFRREADGTPIPGWSWGMALTASAAPDDLAHNQVWLALVAGDHPAAGGQVIGAGLVAVYATFLRRTMYQDKRLSPVLSAADAPFFDGAYRWGSDRLLDRRADEVRCLMDGYASAMGLTLAHEFGHLCGCGHDTEHPTSIMNVVAGAGASWQEAVWIQDHQRLLTQTLGLHEAGR